MTYGRREFLLNEFMDYLNEHKTNNHSKYFNALINLEEYIKAETSFFNPSHISQEQRKDFHKLLTIHDEYNKLGIISLKEKEVIQIMINEFKTKLQPQDHNFY